MADSYFPGTIHKLDFFTLKLPNELLTVSCEILVRVLARNIDNT